LIVAGIEGKSIQQPDGKRRAECLVDRCRKGLGRRGLFAFFLCRLTLPVTKRIKYSLALRGIIGSAAGSDQSDGVVIVRRSVAHTFRKAIGVFFPLGARLAFRPAFGAPQV